MYMLARMVTRPGVIGCVAAWRRGRFSWRAGRSKRVISDPSTTVHQAHLQLVLAALDFAADDLRLAATSQLHDLYATWPGPLVLLLSGAYRDRLQPYTWGFPVVGGWPYK